MKKSELQKRYEVISDMGVDWLEEVIQIFRQNKGKRVSESETYGYWQAVKEAHEKRGIKIEND